MLPVFRFFFRMTLTIVLIGILALAGAWMFGPRTVVDTAIGFDPNSMGADVDAYLAAEEARFPDIRPGLQKQVIWADPANKAKTLLAIVYIHGFSASSGEVRPLPDLLAKALQANLYYARLDGHGRSFDAMGDITVNHWVNDMAEALAIGERIGDRVIIVSTSTGGSLVTWAMGQPSLAAKVSASIFISPNYGLQARGSFLLTMPFASQMAHLIIGPRRSFVPENDIHKAYSSYDYPVEALLPMAEFVKLAAETRVEDINKPAMFVYSPGDLVVRPDITAAFARRWGGPVMVMEVPVVEDPNHHVLAGDGLSPANTEPLAKAMIEWISAALPKPPA